MLLQERAEHGQTQMERKEKAATRDALWCFFFSFVKNYTWILSGFRGSHSLPTASTPATDEHKGGKASMDAHLLHVFSLGTTAHAQKENLYWTGRTAQSARLLLQSSLLTWLANINRRQPLILSVLAAF